MSDQQNFSFHFTAPFPLEKCKRRIESLHEEATLLALRGQMRVIAKTRDVDDTATVFTVHRAPKSSLDISFFPPSVQARGVLKLNQEGQTEVFGEVTLTRLGQVLGSVFVLAFWGWFSYFIGMMITAVGWHPATIIFASGGLLIATILGVWYMQDSSRKEIKRLVEATLQGL